MGRLNVVPSCTERSSLGLGAGRRTCSSRATCTTWTRTAWPDGLREVSQDQGVETVSFCELTCRSGEVADLASIDDSDGKLCKCAGQDCGALHPTGGLADDQRGRQCREAGAEPLDAAFVVGDVEGLIGGVTSRRSIRTRG